MVMHKAFWRGCTVLVTGATGFLGGWLTARLLDYGAHPVCIVRRPRPSSQFERTGIRSRVEVVEGSVADPETFRRAFDLKPIQAVFHVAATGNVADATGNPAEAFLSAAQGTLHLLEEVRRRGLFGCPVVVSSSDKAYGSQEVPFREEMALRPSHPYEVAKATQDMIAQGWGRTYKMAVGVTRCGNYFGGWDETESRIVPGTIRSVLRGEPPVLRSDGNFTRDFLYIEDAVDAQLLFGERLASDPSLQGSAFNFSSEVELTVLEIVHRVLTEMGSGLAPVIANTARAEIPLMRLSNDRSRAVLGWRPEVGFDEGLRRTIDWYRREGA